MMSLSQDIAPQGLLWGSHMIRKIGVVLAALAGLYLALALGLTFWPAHGFDHPAPAVRPAPPETAAYRPRSFVMRDGVRLYGREFDPPPGAETPTTVLLVHGVGADGSELEPAARRLRDGGGARVVVLDLRGHGRSGGPRWNVAYAGQYEDDLADTLAALRREQPQGRLVLAAHSMGGGIALSYALKPATPVDGYLLAAPLLGPTAPTARQGGSGAGAGAGFARFRTPRLFGVLMFDLVGVHAFDRLPILELNIPGRPAYGFAALQSMQPNAPNDYRAALKAIRQPLLLVAGSRDEAFNAAAYPGVIAAAGHGEALIVPGATHNSVLTDPLADQRMDAWLRDLQRPAALAAAYDNP